MKNLRYTGGDAIRELSPDDLRSLGVEDAEYTLSFKQNVSTTVEDDVADILLEKVPDLEESTPEQLAQEEKDLEAELGFALYNPADYTVAQVSDELARSANARREYILDQERVGLNRKTVFAAVGEPWEETPPAEATDVETDSDGDPHTPEVAVTDAASGTPAPTPSSTGNTSTSAT